MAIECRQNLPNRPINLLDDVAIQTARRFAAEFVAHTERHMRHGVRHVQKERTVVMSRFDELDGPLGVAGRQLRDIRVGLDDLVPIEQGQRRVRRSFLVLLLGMALRGPMSIGIGESEILVEAVMRREKLRMVAKVPLTKDGRLVTEWLEDLGNRAFAVANADLRPRTQCPQNADAVGVATG